MNAEKYIISQRSSLKEKKSPKWLQKKVRNKATDPCYSGWGLCPVYLPLGISPLPDHSLESPETERTSRSPSVLLGLTPVPGQAWDWGGPNAQFFASSATCGTRRPPVWLDLSALIWPFRWMTIIARICTTLLCFPNIFGLQRAKGRSQALAPGPDCGMNQWCSHHGRRAKA